MHLLVATKKIKFCRQVSIAKRWIVCIALRRDNSQQNVSWGLPEMQHLRSGENQEWSEFSSDRLNLSFESPNAIASVTLKLRQHDVKQNWRVTLNNQEPARLVVNENDMVVYFTVLPDGISPIKRF